MLSIMPTFLDLFHILQAKSKNYPMIDESRIRDDIINQLDLSDSTYLVHHNLNNIVKETCVQNVDTSLHKTRKGQHVLNRSMLMEVIFRFATFLFTN